MKLLIVAQAVDSEDPALGFFVRWITELAKHFEHIEVICLKEGKHELPANVRVHSLGKERGAVSRATYAWRFLSLAWRLRHDYDASFVHMNQEYVLLAGWLWKLLGKPIYLWRNHYAGSWLTDLAAAFCTNVFCTSKYSYTASYTKTVLMPVGIDMTMFKSLGERKAHSILFLARMTPSKRPEVLIEALRKLQEKSIAYEASFYGSPLLQDRAWYEEIQKSAQALSGVHCYPSVTNAETPALYSAHEIFVNTSRSGMLDKTIFEAMACGALVLTSSDDVASMINSRFIFKDGDVYDLAKKLEALLSLTSSERENAVEQLQRVAHTHSLQSLTERLSTVLGGAPVR